MRPQLANQRNSTISKSDQTEKINETPHIPGKPSPIKIKNNYTTYIIILLKETFKYKNFTIHKTNRVLSWKIWIHMKNYRGPKK